MAVTEQHDRIHGDLYNKINACTVAVNGLMAEIRTMKAAMTAETDRYVEPLHRAQDRQFRIAGCLFLTVVFCIGIIGYGAIGKQGMYTVRNTLPAGKGTAVVIDEPYVLPNNDRDIRPQPTQQRGR